MYVTLLSSVYAAKCDNIKKGAAMFIFKKNLTQIVFFDLEFFVPEHDQLESGLSANPFKVGHILLGGTFLRHYPLNNKDDVILKKWIWNFDNEKELLSDIYQFFKSCWEPIRRVDEQCDLVISGIGIGRVDLGYLFSKCLLHGIDDRESLFEVFYQMRILDIEQIAIPYYKSKLKMMYPKTTAELISKFKLETKRESGKTVWAMFANDELANIEERNYIEVTDAKLLYDKILEEVRINNIAPKYSRESIDRVLAKLTSENEKNDFKALFSVNEEEDRFCVADDPEAKKRVLSFFDKAEYWKK
jgi:hypothetical protein